MAITYSSIYYNTCIHPQQSIQITARPQTPHVRQKLLRNHNGIPYNQQKRKCYSPPTPPSVPANPTRNRPPSSRVPTERLPAQEQRTGPAAILDPFLQRSSDSIYPSSFPEHGPGRINHPARRGGRRCRLPWPWPCLPSARLRPPCGSGRGTGRGTRICSPSPARALAKAASSRPAAPLLAAAAAAGAGAFLLRKPGRRGGRRQERVKLACGLVLVCDVRGVTARVLPF